jgi:DNA-binding CsgD family transcriptional regulator
MWRRHPPSELTPRQQQVLELLRRGLTNEEIAQRLDISLAGVKYHVSQILSRLGVAAREEAASVSLDRRRPWWVGWPLWAPIALGTTAAMAGAAVVFALSAIDSSREQEVFTLAADVQTDRGAPGTLHQPNACDWARYDGPRQAGWDAFLSCGVDFLFPSSRGDSCLWEAIKDDVVAASWLSEGQSCGWRGHLALRNDSGVCSPRAECSRLLPPR